MPWILAALFALSAGLAQPLRGAKTIFYDAGNLGAPAAADESIRLRPLRIAPHLVNGGGRLPVGIHYWLETADGISISEHAASLSPGKFRLHIRDNNSGGGFLTVWEANVDGRELTPRFDARWAGHRTAGEEYLVPSYFEFSPNDDARRIIIVWARSQTEVAHTRTRALERLKEIAQWHDLARESDDSTRGEIGTYVVNRSGGPVAAEIIFRRSPVRNVERAKS